MCIAHWVSWGLLPLSSAHWLTWYQIHGACFYPTLTWLWSVVDVAGGWGMLLQGHILLLLLKQNPILLQTQWWRRNEQKCSVSQLSEQCHATIKCYLFTVTVLIWAELLKVTSALCHDTTTTDNTWWTIVHCNQILMCTQKYPSEHFSVYSQLSPDCGWVTDSGWRITESVVLALCALAPSLCSWALALNWFSTHSHSSHLSLAVTSNRCCPYWGQLWPISAQCCHRLTYRRRGQQFSVFGFHMVTPHIGWYWQHSSFLSWWMSSKGLSNKAD